MKFAKSKRKKNEILVFRKHIQLNQHTMASGLVNEKFHLWDKEFILLSSIVFVSLSWTIPYGVLLRSYNKDWNLT